MWPGQAQSGQMWHMLILLGAGRVLIGYGCGTMSWDIQSHLNELSLGTRSWPPEVPSKVPRL
jgi:hypothetical protein